MISKDDSQTIRCALLDIRNRSEDKATRFQIAVVSTLLEPHFFKVKEKK